MLTIFTTTNPFRGHIGVIQTNAIRSWLLLRPECEVILFGNEEGTADIASEFGIRHIPDVDCNEYGTPLVSSMLSIAQDIAKYKLMCLISADILLMSDFLTAICQVQRQSFLLVGQRWDTDLKEPVDFSDPNWETNLQDYVKQVGKLHGKSGIDYFVFPRGLYDDIPPFAIGRTAVDNWLIYQARSLKVPVIDATKAITAIHQNHDYSHHPGGETSVWEGPETMRNRELAGWGEHGFSLEYATWILTHQGLRPALTMRYLYFRLDAVPVLFSHLHFLRKPMKALTKLIVHIRSVLGMTQN